MAKAKSIRINRRNVIKLSGMVTSSLAVAPFTRVHPTSAGQSLQTVNIGVLAPQSTILPAAAERWITGVQSGLAQTWSDYAVQYFVDQYNGRPSDAVEHAQALMDKSSLHALMVLIDAYGSGELRRVCAARSLPLVMSSLGANITRSLTDNSAYAYQTLDYWQALTTLGAWAANNLGRRVVTASSFYESGYDLSFAFRVGYENAGGTIASSHVSHMPTSGGDLSQLMSAIQNAAPDVVYASYCGQEAVDFVRAYTEAGLSRHIPLVASSFMVDDMPLSSLGSDAVGIYSCVAWDTEPFALLGQRAAQRTISLVNMRNSTAGHLSRAVYIPAFQTGTPPPAPSSSAAKFFMRKVQPAGSGVRNVVIDTLSADDSNASLTASIADVKTQLLASTKTGWLSEYLC